MSIDHPCQIMVYQGHQEIVSEESKKIQYIPLKNSQFEQMIVTANCFDKSGDKPQKFPPNLISINVNNFFRQGQDLTRAALAYSPVIVVMTSDDESFQYESIFHFQFIFNRGSHPSLQMLRQKIVYNSQVFELSEAYGLKGEKAGEDDYCVICLTNPKETISKPCKHVSLCSSCANVVFQSERKCPVCRQGISEIIPFQIINKQTGT